MLEPEFGAQASDEYVQVLPFILVFLTPDRAQQVGMGECLPGANHQLLEEEKLRRCNFYFLVIHKYPPCGEAYLNVVAAEGVSGWRGENWLAAAEHRSYPG